jgi:hypothetical protein
MAHYRIYLLDDYGRIFVGSDAECVGDAEALDRAAETLADVGHLSDQAEVWIGARSVGLVSAPAKPCGPSLGRSLERAPLRRSDADALD